MNDKSKRGIRIGIATVVIAIAMLAMVPSASAGAKDVTGSIKYESGTHIPGGWTVCMENLNETYPTEPWCELSDDVPDPDTGWNYGVGGQAADDEKYFQVYVTSPDGKWYGEKIDKLADAFERDHPGCGFYEINVVVTEVIIPEEEYSKYLPSGWNLISLPLEPTTGNESTSKVLETVSYDAVQRYNATSHSWEDVMSGTMESGVGYFVHVTTAGTWTYSGTAYTSMSIDLQPGLNMIGSLNCTKTISNALSSIGDDYVYVARWNPALPDDCKYETNVTVAPNGFNDFADMERGTGYFVSVSAATTITLTEEC